MSHRMTAQFILGCFVTIAGLVLLYVGCFVPPIGEIDYSLLVAFGEVATFAGALIGVDYHYRYRVESGDLQNKHKINDDYENISERN